jgi:O-antigen ligase
MSSGAHSFEWWRSAMHRSSDVLFLSLLALAPLPFGLTAPLPLAFVCVGLAVSLLAADFRSVDTPHLRGIWPVLTAMAIYLAVAAMQHRSGSADGLPAAPIWAEAEALLGVPLPARPAWSVSKFWISMGAPIVAVLSLIRATVLCATRGGAARLWPVLAASGAAYAVFGVIAHLMTPDLLLWRPKTAYFDAVTGPFVNRNTAATYWGTCSVICLAMAMHRLTGRRGRQTRGLVPPWLRAAWPWAGLAACLLALAMTGSRAGTGLTLAALILVATLLWASRTERPRWSFRRGGSALLAGTVVMLVLGGATMARVRVYGLYDEQRAVAYGDTLSMIAAHPWLGVGIGAFADVFPRFRSSELGSSGIWDRAHSTPLEIAAEAGLPVTTLIAATCLFLVYLLLRGSFRRRRDRVYPVAALGCMWLGIAHSCVDFSLQIPGYTVVFAAVIGCGLAQCVSSRSNGGSADEG